MRRRQLAGSKLLLSLRATRGHESRYHASQCCHLPARLGRVIRIIVSPPVPASFKIALVRNGRRLRIKHDDPIGIGPFIVTRVAHEGCLKGHKAGTELKVTVARVLPTAVERDVQPTRILTACRRYVEPARIVTDRTEVKMDLTLNIVLISIFSFIAVALGLLLLRTLGFQLPS